MTKPNAPNGEEPLARVLGRLAGRLRRADPGTVAELRRIAPGDFPAAFWCLYFAVVPRDWREPGGMPSVSADQAWAAVIRGMVELGPTGLDFRQPLGAALAESGYSEMRFIRLIRARGDDIGDEFRIAGQWLANKGFAADLRPAAEVVLGHVCRGLAARVKPYRAAHRMARDYFRVAGRS